VQSLNLKLERLATQHASLVACTAQQQEAWEGQTSQDLREVKEAIGQLAAIVAPSQRQMHHLTAQVAQLQGQLFSQRALAAVQHLVMALAVLALGTGWAPSALWALAAAAGAALVAVLMGFGNEEAADARAAAQELRFAQQQQQQQQQRAAIAARGGGAAAGADQGVAGGLEKALDGSGLRVLATACGGSDVAAAPPPMTAATEALLIGRVFGGKTIDETVRGGGASVVIA